MKYLNLSPALSLQPALPYESFTFSGGEPHLKIDPSSLKPGEPVCISVQARSADDVLRVLLAADALQRLGVQHIELFIPYFPAARQDRVMVPGEPLSVKVYAGLINAVGFSRVTVFDAHSEVTPALLDACQALNNHRFVAQVIAALPDAKQLTLVAPDAGSAKKMHHLAGALRWEHVVQCDKTRDVRTGQLSGAQVFSDDLAGADCLLVDDICDGGGTFIALAAALRAKNAGRLYLAVSHGIFSKGTEAVTAHFDRVFTTNSFYQGATTDKVRVLPVTSPDAF
ncbi:MAG: ribose-phosphate pyrophosphokinase [Saprospiraceae bacterium]|nr:ribose-phosphate pyrophosphokinase [Saprospiraceae bacterium]